MDDIEKQEEVAKNIAGAEDDVVIDQLSLGFLYATGAGVSQNYILAYKWFLICESNFLSNELYKGAANIMKDMAAKNMTPEDIEEAEKLAQEWIKINRDEWAKNELEKLSKQEQEE